MPLKAGLTVRCCYAFYRNRPDAVCLHAHPTETPITPHALRFRVVMALFGVYFIYHAFHGNHGLLAYAQVQVRVETLSIEKNELEARRAALAARVNALRYGGLDGDLLDEEARNALAVIGHNERLIID